MHIRDAVFLGQSCDLLAEVGPVIIGVAVARVLVVVVRGETDADPLGAHRVRDGGDHFEWEADPILDATAVRVGAGVDVVVQELLEEVTICARDVNFEFWKPGMRVSGLPMDLNAVESGLDGALCARDKVLGDGFDFLDCHRLGWRIGVGLSGQSIAFDGDSGSAERLVSINEIRDCGTSVVPDLAEDIPAFRVDGIGDFLPARDLLVGEDTWNPWVPTALCNPSAGFD